jgi:hypothetical protein
MRKVVLTYGIIAGVIIAILMMVSMSLMDCGSGSDFSGSYIIGYSTMIVALSMIFFGIRSYRQNYSNGTITFGKAFLIGLYITLIASAFYVIGWLIYSSIAMPDFADKYMAHEIAGMKKEGLSDSLIAIKSKEMADWKQLYDNNLLFKIGMTFAEIFPVGLVVSLICAAILRKKPKVAGAK